VDVGASPSNGHIAVGHLVAIILFGEKAAFVAVVEKATLLADASGFALNDLSRDDER
jgi:hypothetical protein